MSPPLDWADRQKIRTEATTLLAECPQTFADFSAAVGPAYAQDAFEAAVHLSGGALPRSRPRVRRGYLDGFASLLALGGAAPLIAKLDEVYPLPRGNRTRGLDVLEMMKICDEHLLVDGASQAWDVDP